MSTPKTTCLGTVKRTCLPELSARATGERWSKGGPEAFRVPKQVLLTNLSYSPPDQGRCTCLAHS